MERRRAYTDNYKFINSLLLRFVKNFNKGVWIREDVIETTPQGGCEVDDRKTDAYPIHELAEHFKIMDTYSEEEEDSPFNEDAERLLTCPRCGTARDAAKIRPRLEGGQEFALRPVQKAAPFL